MARTPNNGRGATIMKSIRCIDTSSLSLYSEAASERHVRTRPTLNEQEK